MLIRVCGIENTYTQNNALRIHAPNKLNLVQLNNIPHIIMLLLFCVIEYNRNDSLVIE
jgi:hypothetical protein